MGGRERRRGEGGKEGGNKFDGSGSVKFLTL